MASVSGALALGGVAKGFREADERSVQREAISSRERIATAGFDATEKKGMTDRAVGQLTNIITGINKVQRQISPDNAAGVNQKIFGEIATLERTFKGIVTIFENQWKGPKGQFFPNPMANPIALANQNRLLALALANVEDADREATAAGRGTALEDVSKARTTAKKTGASVEQTFQAQGLTPSPESPEAKLINDRVLFVSQFGEKSPQVQALDEAVSATGAPDLKDVRGIRQEFTKASGDFVSVRDAFGKVLNAANNPSPANDIALIFNFMKILDPTSVVREGEQATVSNARGVDETVRSLYNRVIAGEKLGPNQRLDLSSAAAGAFQAQLRFQISLEDQFRGVATRAKANEKDVVLDFIGDLRKVLPPADEPNALFVKFDKDGNAIFRRPDGTGFVIE